MHGIDVLQAEHADRVRDEADLLAVGVEQREMPLRGGDGERQSGKSRTGADIGDPRALQRVVHAEAVEQVMRQHLPTVADRSEVVRHVPAFEFVQQAQHGACLLVV